MKTFTSGGVTFSTWKWLLVPLAAVTLGCEPGVGVPTPTTLPPVWNTSFIEPGDPGSSLCVPSAYGSRILGTPGDDVLTGTAGDDVICGYGGNDTIDGGDGADTVYGGSGNDQIYGGAGEDRLYPWLGDDYTSGGSERDVIAATHGINEVDAGTGNDIVSSDNGATAAVPAPRNTVFLGPGDDDYSSSLVAGGGISTVYGGSGYDIIRGGAGDDYLDVGPESPGTACSFTCVTEKAYGNGGRDVLKGGLANDMLSGGDGDDVLFAIVPGDATATTVVSDDLYGGFGSDTIVAIDGGPDRIIAEPYSPGIPVALPLGSCSASTFVPIGGQPPIPRGFGVTCPIGSLFSGSIDTDGKVSYNFTGGALPISGLELELRNLAAGVHPPKDICLCDMPVNAAIVPGLTVQAYGDIFYP